VKHRPSSKRLTAKVCYVSKASRMRINHFDAYFKRATTGEYRANPYNSARDVLLAPCEAVWLYGYIDNSSFDKTLADFDFCNRRHNGASTGCIMYYIRDGEPPSNSLPCTMDPSTSSAYILQQPARMPPGEVLTRFVSSRDEIQRSWKIAYDYSKRHDSRKNDLWISNFESRLGPTILAPKKRTST